MRPAGGGAGAAPGVEQLTAANLGGLQEGGGAGAAPVVEEELTAATVGWPRRKGA